MPVPPSSTSLPGPPENPWFPVLAVSTSFPALPSTVSKSFETEPRSAAQMTGPEFQATKARIEELIHPPRADSAEQESDALPMIRLTDVADNVE